MKVSCVWCVRLGLRRPSRGALPGLLISRLPRRVALRLSLRSSRAPAMSISSRALERPAAMAALDGDGIARSYVPVAAELRQFEDTVHP